jgi:hypothetical protein
MFGTLANGLVIMACCRNPRLRTIQYTIFLLLAITDIGVTAFVQPIFVIATLSGLLGKPYTVIRARNNVPNVPDHGDRQSRLFADQIKI